MNHKRILLIIITVTLLFSLFCHHSSQFNNNDPTYNKFLNIFNNLEIYNNTRISFQATIKRINTTTETVTLFIQESPYNYPSFDMRINLSPHSLKKGDLIEIIGILNGKNQVTAEQIWLQEDWKNNLIYLRSLPAIPFALYLFFKAYRFNKKTYRFERRNHNA